MSRSDRIEDRRRRDAEKRAEMLRLPTVTLERFGQLLPPDANFEMVGADVTATGEMVVLWAGRSEVSAFQSSTTEPGWAIFPDSRTPSAVRAVVAVHGSDTRIASRITNLSVAHPFVQLLPQDRVLVVGARCRWTETGAEHNGIVYDSDGNLLIEATLGDGIQHLRTTPTGSVWVGYFDEGVFGNYGWGVPNGPRPIGAPGIVRFTSDLELSWEYPSNRHRPWSSIDDCYALNADDETIWACHYSDWPIVRVQNGVVRAWTNAVGGARALAVGSDQVWLAGGYSSEKDRLVVGTLEADIFHVQAVKRIVLPDGSELPDGTRISGVGNKLHVVHGQDWFILSAEE